MKSKNNVETEFVRVLDEHRTTIYTVCFLFSKDKDEVNDMYQEVCINLWKGFGKFAGRSDIKTWIYRVSLNTCIFFRSEEEKKKYGAADGRYRPI